MSAARLLRGAPIVAFLVAQVWQVLGAVSDLLLWLGLAATTHGRLSGTAWSLLLLGLAIPVAASVLGLLAARRRGSAAAALILLAALGASRALGVTQLAFFLQLVGSL